MTTPLVTSLMPIFIERLANDEKPVIDREILLRTAIRTAASQTYKPYNLILIDNGSTDATAVDIQKEASERWPDTVRLAREASQRGTAYALDAGLKTADSDTVYFTKADSDDIFHRDREKNRVAVFETLPDPQVSIVYDDFFQLNYEPRPHIQPVILPAYDYRRYLEDSFIHGNSMWRSNVYERWGGPLKETFVYNGYDNPKGCNFHGEDLAHWLAITDFSDAFHLSADPAFTWVYRKYISSKYMQDRKHVDYCRTYLQQMAKERRGLA